MKASIRRAVDSSGIDDPKTQTEGLEPDLPRSSFSDTPPPPDAGRRFGEDSATLLGNAEH